MHGKNRDNYKSRVYAKRSGAKIFEKKKIILGPKTAILGLKFLVVRGPP